MTELLQSLGTIVVFILVLGGLVLIHEIGHFVTARAAKVKVLEFGIGFPPRAKVIKRGEETTYTLNWLPIGGFVKLEGEDGDEKDDPRSFSNQRLLTKIVILVAGVVMNLLLAFTIFTGIALWGEPAIGVTTQEIAPGSPAEAIGLQPGDTIVMVNGTEYSAFDQRLPVDDLRSMAGETIVIGVVHADGSEQEYTVTLRVPASEDEGALGVAKLSGTQVGTINRSFIEAVQVGWQRTVDAFTMILDGLGQLGQSIVTNPTAAPEASGPVGIAFQVGDILWNLGPLYVLYLAGLLSANLALVNILPFPPLDGGRILVLLLKAIPGLGPRISLRAEQLTYALGFVALFSFLIWITVFDIARQVGGGN
jgi:regulator of sigma E protease